MLNANKLPTCQANCPALRAAATQQLAGARTRPSRGGSTNPSALPRILPRILPLILLQIPPPSALPEPPPNNDIANFATEFFEKVLRGLKNIQSNRSQVTPLGLGEQLLELRQNAKADTMELERVLQNYQSKSCSDKWLAGFYARYSAVRRRFLDPRHSETGDTQKERNELKREVIWEVTSAVVNRLEPYWGVCASLIYNALKETRFKGCNLYKKGGGIGSNRLNEIINAIVGLFLAADIKVNVDNDTPVVNPAFFLTLVSYDVKYVISINSSTTLTNSRYADICRSIKLDNFAELQLDENIDGLEGNISELEIYSGQIRLSVLLGKEVGEKLGRTWKRSGNGLTTIHFRPIQVQG
ncbi:hypothetical protein QBC36DRAFT_199026 [Triangularia setosa]|uniref:Uncharacterized protein n=1 Tax=Triangularia setosa TaxID=2587417 RepID=A0AAN6VZF9_9PEZI|nr:hypothetical protein QBC36DRAFT_199026 [Podospora setosa]